MEDRAALLAVVADPVLREARLVTAQKRGRWVDYTLAEDALDRLALALPRPEPASLPPAACRRDEAP